MHGAPCTMRVQGATCRVQGAHTDDGFLMRRVIVMTALAAFAAFCLVQDCVTASGARRYVRLHRDALAGRGPLVTVDDVMAPAVRKSVRDGLLAAGGVSVVGAGIMAAFHRRRR